MKLKQGAEYKVKSPYRKGYFVLKIIEDKDGKVKGEVTESLSREPDPLDKIKGRQMITKGEIIVLPKRKNRFYVQDKNK